MRDDGELRQYHCGVLDEHGVRQVRRGRESHYFTSKIFERSLVRSMLRGCTIEVDSPALEMGELARSDARRHGARNRHPFRAQAGLSFLDRRPAKIRSAAAKTSDITTNIKRGCGGVTLAPLQVNHKQNAMKIVVLAHTAGMKRLSRARTNPAPIPQRTPSPTTVNVPLGLNAGG
jgi:hypothetical protein